MASVLENHKAGQSLREQRPSYLLTFHHDLHARNTRDLPKPDHTGVFDMTDMCNCFLIIIVIIIHVE